MSNAVLCGYRLVRLSCQMLSSYLVAFPALPHIYRPFRRVQFTASPAVLCPTHPLLSGPLLAHPAVPCYFGPRPFFPFLPCQTHPLLYDPVLLLNSPPIHSAPIPFYPRLPSLVCRNYRFLRARLIAANTSHSSERNEYFSLNASSSPIAVSSMAARPSFDSSSRAVT